MSFWDKAKSRRRPPLDTAALIAAQGKPCFPVHRAHREHVVLIHHPPPPVRMVRWFRQIMGRLLVRMKLWRAGGCRCRQLWWCGTQTATERTCAGGRGLRLQSRPFCLNGLFNVLVANVHTMTSRSSTGSDFGRPDTWRSGSLSSVPGLKVCFYTAACCM